MSQFTEEQQAEMVLSARALADSWEQAETLSEEEIQNDLEALLNVMEGKSSFAEFKFETEVDKGQSRSQ